MVRSRVLDIDCFVGDLDSAVDAVIRRALSGEGGLACCANAHVLVTSQRNEELKLALQSSWTVFPDGSPVAWLQRRSGFVSAQRIAGPDLMPAVLDRGDRAGCGTFSSDRRDPLLTQSRRGSWRCSRVSRSSAPRLRARATRTWRRCWIRFGRASLTFVWIALGAPKQEVWAQRHRTHFGSSLLLPVGAAFDFIAGAKPRAPEWMQENGLEWLHRLGTEPRRLGWRYLSTNSVFLLRALRELSYR